MFTNPRTWDPSARRAAGREAGLGTVRLLAATAVALLTAVTLGDRLAGTGGAGFTGATPRTAVCTFTNPAHAGECVERTEIAEESTAEEACRVILDCLNDPRCVAAYCNSSTVRSGWVLKKAEER